MTTTHHRDAMIEAYGGAALTYTVTVTLTSAEGGGSTTYETTVDPELKEGFWTFYGKKAGENEKKLYQINKDAVLMIVTTVRI